MLILATLRKTHKRAEFDCGNEALNTYIRTQASQDVRQNDANCYVLSEDDGDEIFGFFTLSNISLERKNLTIRSAYSTVPATLLGRMAVSVLHQHKGYARYMVANAIELCQQSPSATRALVVDAKDETVLDFYLHLNFFRLSETGLRAVLLLPKRSL